MKYFFLSTESLRKILLPLPAQRPHLDFAVVFMMFVCSMLRALLRRSWLSNQEKALKKAGGEYFAGGKVYA